jgi:hypothetical protein
MSLIGLELNDCGLLAAAGNPPELIELDGQARESPGFALPQKKGLLVGKAAESQAHLFPRQILNHFWDHLNTEPLEHPGKYIPQSHAEIVYRHLSLIWQQLQTRGNEVVMAVPSFYKREQLGLILGIARELGMPVKGFVPLTLAASSHICPEKMLLHIDVHLHRVEVSYLEQGESLTLRDSATTAGKGLIRLYREWVDAIAREFVAATRFDPLHQASTEQHLYDRLPAILSHFRHNSAMLFEINGGSTPYSITLERDLFIREAESVYAEILRLIERMRNKRSKNQTPVAIQLSHRLTRLPGCRARLAMLKGAQIIELDRGAAAKSVPEIWHQVAAQHNNRETSLFTSRPWQLPRRSNNQGISTAQASFSGPTHVLYRNIAYPITEKPLTVGCTQDGEHSIAIITGETDGLCSKHFTIERRGKDIILNDTSAQGTFVDEKRVNGSIKLKLGQVIRVGTPGEQLQLIACLTSA